MLAYAAHIAIALSWCGSGWAQTIDWTQSCEATAHVNLSKLDLRDVKTIRVHGIEAKVTRKKLPRGHAPQITIKTNCAPEKTPVVSVVDKRALVIKSAQCGVLPDPAGNSVNTNVSLEEGTAVSGARQASFSIWISRLLLIGPLALDRTPGGVWTSALMIAGMMTFASAEPTCEDKVEIEIALPDDSPDLSTASARMEVLEALKEASEPTTPSDDPLHGVANGFTVNPHNHRLYVNGQHRRPTDPATAQEIIAAQQLLFGKKGDITSLNAAAALASKAQGWAAATSALAHVGGVDPAAINGVSEVISQPGDPTNGEAQQAFLDYAKANSFSSAYAWLRQPAQEPMRRSLRWWNVNAIATATPVREHVVAVENAIEAKASDYDMRRVIFIRMTGGQTALTANDTKLWGSELHIAVDVSDPRNPHVVPDRIEVYSQLQRDYTMPGPQPLESLDQVYLIAAAMALYGNNHAGLPRHLNVFYNGDPKNTQASYGPNTRAFQRPFEWLDGANAKSIGENSDEFMMIAQLSELSPSTVPYDGHQMMSGTFMFPIPLTMVYAVRSNGTKILPDPHNTLPQSQATALCFFGRGLTFSQAEVSALQAALNTTNLFNSNFTAIAGVMSGGIARAWGSDEATPSSNFRPGVLARRHDGVQIPKVVLKHAFNVPTFINHATAKVLNGKLLDPASNHRDARNNLDHMAPPVDQHGTPMYKPNGRPRSVVQVNGQSFVIDGYGVTYHAAITWKFLIGLDYDAGLTIYHIRTVLPPSRAHPKGKEVPYLYRAYSPNFGTDYSTSSLGNGYSYMFFESHFQDLASVSQPSTCNGATLPLWRTRGGAYFEPSTNYFSTYGQVPPVMDPFSAELGHSAQMQAFPYHHDMVERGLYPHAICLQEVDMGHAMWHMYSAQHLRGLQVTQSTVSDAYNVLLRYTFQSDGKIKVGASAHGKPATGQHGVPGTGGQHASDGHGGFAENHLHWYVFALEPQLKLDTPGVLNKLLVSDLVPPSEEPADWFGTAFHRKATQVFNASETDKMRYKQERQRRWHISALNATTGEEMGALRVSSHQFGYAINPGTKHSHFRPEDTYYGTHWWLHQDLYVVNSTGRRDSTVLLASSTNPGYNPHRATGHALKDSPKYDHPVVFCMVKLPHEVISDELPVQSGFAHLEVTIEPHNLHGFNPLILARNDPSWNDFMENTWMKSYEPPYTSEYGEPQ